MGAPGAPVAPASCQLNSMGFPTSYPPSDVGGCPASGMGSCLAGYPAAEVGAACHTGGTCAAASPGYPPAEVGAACHTGGTCAAASPMYPEMYPAMMQNG